MSPATLTRPYGNGTLLLPPGPRFFGADESFDQRGTIITVVGSRNEGDVLRLPGEEKLKKSRPVSDEERAIQMPHGWDYRWMLLTDRDVETFEELADAYGYRNGRPDCHLRSIAIAHLAHDMGYDPERGRMVVDSYMLPNETHNDIDRAFRRFFGIPMQRKSLVCRHKADIRYPAVNRADSAAYRSLWGFGAPEKESRMDLPRMFERAYESDMAIRNAA